MITAQVTEIGDGAGKILEGASQHGAVVYLSVFFGLSVLFLMGLILWGLYVAWIKPEQSRRDRHEEQALAESKARIEDSRKQAAAFESSAQTLQSLLVLSKEHKTLHQSVQSMVEELLVESKRLMDLHTSTATPFSTTSIEESIVLILKTILDLAKTGALDLDKVLMGKMDTAISESMDRLRRFKK